jgi:hypothetical protein
MLETGSWFLDTGYQEPEHFLNQKSLILVLKSFSTFLNSVFNL